MNKTVIIVHTDGGARGNPGPAGIGVVIQLQRPGHNPEPLRAWGRKIGETTNNVAEYTAVVDALAWLVQRRRDSDTLSGAIDEGTVHFFLDSTLVVNQINGVFRVKDEKMRALLFEVKQLEQKLEMEIEYSAVRREFNREADVLVNQALDAP